MHPILLQIGDFYIAWYGVFVALAILAGAAMSGYLAHRQGIDVNLVLDVLLVVVISLVVGARLFYIATVWDDFLRDPWPHLLSRTGFVFLGGLVGAVVGATIYVRRRNIPVWRLGDIAAPSIPLGHGIGRLGCHMTGCCYGGLCPPGWESWGLHVPPGLLQVAGAAEPQIVGGYAFFDQLERGLIPPDAAHSLAVWPIQLISAGANVALAGLLLWIYFRRRWNGQAFLAYFLLYGFARFVLEIFRGDAERGVFTLGAGWTLSFSQGIALVIMAGAGGLFALGRKGKLPAQDKDFPPEVRIERPKTPPQAVKAPAPSAIPPESHVRSSAFRRSDSVAPAAATPKRKGKRMPNRKQ